MDVCSFASLETEYRGLRVLTRVVYSVSCSSSRSHTGCRSSTALRGEVQSGSCASPFGPANGARMCVPSRRCRNRRSHFPSPRKCDSSGREAGLGQSSGGSSSGGPAHATPPCADRSSRCRRVVQRERRCRCHVCAVKLIVGGAGPRHTVLGWAELQWRRWRRRRCPSRHRRTGHVAGRRT